MPNTRPRWVGSLRSTSQDSTIIAAPANAKPVTARSAIQAQACTNRELASSDRLASALTTANARTWPTRATSRGTRRQPST